MLVLRLHSLGRTTFATLIAINIDCSLNELKRKRTVYALDSSGEFYAHAYAMRLCNGRVIEMKTSEQAVENRQRPTQTLTHTRAKWKIMVSLYTYSFFFSIFNLCWLIKMESKRATTYLPNTHLSSTCTALLMAIFCFWWCACDTFSSI